MPNTLARHSRSIALITTVLAVVLTVSPTGAARDEKPQKKPVKASLTELWMEPAANRDLFAGVGGRRLAPDARQLFKVIEIKASGFSDGYAVVGTDDREWSVKFPPEASTEIIASRILWGIGYHQPPIYYVASWRATGADDPNPQRPARFREKHPNLRGLKDEGSWAYDDNPFVGTRQLNALLVYHAMLGNSDLKPGNNAIYSVDRPLEGARRWYVARDLGQTFGRTGVLDAPRGDIDVFEKTPFVLGVKNGLVELEFHGRQDELFQDIRIADVEWLCRRLNQLTERQWRDAFRAGGYEDALAKRFIRRMKQKIAEGLKLTSRAPRERRMS